MTHTTVHRRLQLDYDHAHECKQAARRAQQTARLHMDQARTEMERAREKRQDALHKMHVAWGDHRSSQDRLNSDIASLNCARDEAKRHARQLRREAGRRHDATAARSYMSQARHCEALVRTLAVQRRLLLTRIHSTKERHERLSGTYRQASRRFDARQQKFYLARDNLRQASYELTQANDHVTETARALRKAIDSDAQQCRDLAQKAGVPEIYLDTLCVIPKPSGVMNIYFGGIDAPNGPGHGHYVMNVHGKVSYQRDPFEPHGAHNYTINSGDQNRAS